MRNLTSTGCHTCVARERSPPLSAGWLARSQNSLNASARRAVITIRNGAGRNCAAHDRFLQPGIASMHGGNMKTIPPEVVGQHRAKLDIIVNEEDLFHLDLAPLRVCPLVRDECSNM